MKGQDYVKAMRQSLCNEEIRDKDGNLNHVYFLNKKNCYWGEAQRRSLLDALTKFEIGDWMNFKTFLAFQRFSNIELELRICMLLKVKDINPWMGKKLTSEELTALKE